MIDIRRSSIIAIWITWKLVALYGLRGVWMSFTFTLKSLSVNWSKPNNNLANKSREFQKGSFNHCYYLSQYSIVSLNSWSIRWISFIFRNSSFEFRNFIIDAWVSTSRDEESYYLFRRSSLNVTLCSFFIASTALRRLVS